MASNGEHCGNLPFQAGIAGTGGVIGAMLNNENFEVPKLRCALRRAASLDGVWEWATETELVHFSPGFARLLGYGPDELPGHINFLRKLIHPEDEAQMWTTVEDHLRILLDEGKHRCECPLVIEERRAAPYFCHGNPAAEAFDVECRFRTKSDGYRWFRSRGVGAHDRRTGTTWLVGTIQDIHQLKETEFSLREALGEIKRLQHRQQAEINYLRKEIRSFHGFDEIVGRSDVMRAMLNRIELVAKTDVTTLLLGETGTGKGVLARAIHLHSKRCKKPLVKVNCAALPSNLMESELFGRVKGAYTGATHDEIGRFELADGGTIFLDEIGELDPERQADLLRVLEEGEFERVGSAKTYKVDVRVIAATNRDLETEVKEGNFRADLFFRLSIVPIRVPPLRERPEDIPLLVHHFIEQKKAMLNKPVGAVPDEVMESLIAYDWPGNVRELQNVIERAMILSDGPTLTLSETGPLTARTGREQGQSSAEGGQHAPETLDDIERSHLIRVLDECGWRIKGPGNAAERLGLAPSTLRSRMRKLGITRPDSGED